MRISKLYVLIGFFVANIGPAASTNPLEPESDVKRKTLYLHVGPQKTGSSSIQTVFSVYADHFLKKGIYYPRSMQKQEYTKGHKQLVDLIRRGKMAAAYAELREITDAAGPASILLSSEQFSPHYENPHFVGFISYLQQNYDLRVIYCIRDTAEVLASALCFSAFFMTDDMLKFETASAYLTSYFVDINRMLLFFAQFKTTFLFFDELTADHKLVANFFKQCFDMEIDLPEITVNDKGSHGQTASALTPKQLKKLEKFVGLAKGELSSPYNSGDPNKSEFTEKLYAFSKMHARLLLESYDKKKVQTETPAFLTSHPKFHARYVQAGGYEGRVLDYLIKAYQYSRKGK